MNKRIKELIYQATLATYYDAETRVTRETFDKEKFAELIVLECAEIAKDYAMSIPTYADADDVGEKIKEHFGVEA